MIKYQIHNQEGKVVGDYELKSEIFGLNASQNLLHQAVVTQMSNERKVLADTKDRSEVSGGGKKPWKQKGTGRARVGSSRSPLWRGGGIVFGPTNDRNFKIDLNKKMGRKALFMALSNKVNNQSLALLDKLELSEFKTKAFKSMLESLTKAAWSQSEVAAKSVLIINVGNNDKAKYSARNLDNVKLINLDNINIIDLLQHERLILTVEAVKQLEARIK
jgi:large subunit ribosomal protein L4